MARISFVTLIGATLLLLVSPKAHASTTQRRRTGAIPSQSPSFVGKTWRSSSRTSPRMMGNNAILRETQEITPSGRPLAVLQASTFVIVVASALVAFSPVPALVAKLGTERATNTLSVMTASAALMEIVISPLVGSILDSFGRKPVLVAIILAFASANGLVALHPSVVSICTARVIGILCVGLFIITSQAITGDVASSSPERLGTAMGRQMALTSAGFFLGALAGGRLTTGLSVSYGISASVIACAAILVAFGMQETLAPSERIPFRGHAAALMRNPLSCTRILFRHGSQVRILAILLMLQAVPQFMGDFFQIYARTEWQLTTKDFSSFVAMFGIIGIVANTVASVMVRKLGIKHFTAIATLSSICSPLGAYLFHFKGAVVGSLVGFLAAAQNLGITAALVSEGHKSGVPHGELAGERSAILALLKVVGPIWYSMLYVQGQRLFGIKSLPFLFNFGLAFAAFCISQTHLSN